ncbi:MAG: OFA family MFS transporter [Deltaproteobacteria bacterium]|nr:OFA family MFS transporter [Deltaproteobacteria bacterium]
MPPSPRERWIIAVAATLMQVALGAVYAWSVFRKPLAVALDASVMDVNLAFTITNVMLGIAAFVGGLVMTRVGPRVIGIVAGCLYGLGIFLAGFADHHLGVLYLTYGVLAGTGIGLGYIVPLATLVRWFPDRRGMITGIAVAGFGGGALVFGPIARALIAAVGPFMTFHILGVLFLVVVVGAAAVMREPPRGYAPAGWRPIAANAAPPVVDYDLGAALRTWQWYALWVALFLSVGAGISIIAEVVPMAQELVGASDRQAAALVGTIAIFNSAGRMVWSSLSDVIGRRAVFVAMFLIQASVFFLLPGAGTYDRFIVLACVSLLCYGGAFGTMPSLVADYFGARNVGRVYGLLLTAWSAGAVLGPLILSRLRDATGDYTRGLYVLGAIMVVGAIVPIVLQAPAGARRATEPRFAGRLATRSVTAAPSGT